MMLSSLTLCVSGDPFTRTLLQDIHDRQDVARLEVIGRAEKALLRIGRPDLTLLLIQPAADTLSSSEAELLRVAADHPVKVGLIATAAQASTLAAAAPGVPTFAVPGDEYRLLRFVEDAHARHFHADDTQADELPAEANTPLLGSEWHELMKRIRRVARQDTTVLLTGETGCGKTMLARLLHAESPRAGKPLVIADCAAMNDTLGEGDLFGHVRGAYTGADRDRTGKLAAVGGGTLVLDEINTLPLALQGKLLRAVDEQVFEPLGSNTPQRFDGRIIAVSNVSLEEAVRQGRFRSDLYYRLNVVEFHLPTLRERPGAIIPLAQQFVRESRAAALQGVTSITPEAMQRLLRYPWPGNVRELRNAIERASALAVSAAIDVDDLPPTVVGGEFVPAPTVRVEPQPVPVAPPMCERERIMAVLAHHKNNRLAAARVLGISRNSLYKKMHRLGIYLSKRESAGLVSAAC
jgi:DNA-binding NtrC family response regulator